MVPNLEIGSWELGVKEEKFSFNVRVRQRVDGSLAKLEITLS